MQELNLRGLESSGDPESVRKNIQHALSLKLPEFGPSLAVHDGTMVICGSGPSLPKMGEEIKKDKALGRPIVAVKGAYNYLMDIGIEPDWYVNIEFKDRRNTVQTPNKKTVYMIASRCQPSLFEHLQGCNVVLFHTWAPNEDIPELHGRLQVTGGSTSGMRAITLGYAQGFRKFVLYGMDSCITEDRVKRFYDTESLPKEATLQIMVADRWFTTNGAMGLQAQDFRDSLRLMPDCQFEVKGGGLLAAINEEFLRRKAA